MNKKIIIGIFLLVTVVLAIFLVLYTTDKSKQIKINDSPTNTFGTKIGNTQDWVMIYTAGMPFSFKAPKGWFAYPGNTPTNFVIANKEDIKSTAPDSVFMEIQGKISKARTTSTLDFVKTNFISKQAKAAAYGTTESGLAISKFENIKGTPGSGTAYAVDLSPTTFAFIVIERNGNPTTTEQIVQSIFLPIQ